MADPQPELRAVFCEALDRQTPQEQGEYLDQACRGRPELRARVEALLRAHGEVSGFLREPLGQQTGLEEPANAERPGTVIGPYKLLEQIGEGGFGVVFMAEQLHPVRRKVALKVLKPGMDTRQVVARFEAERQALALMDHPNIAHVFDGGETPPAYAGGSQRPYFVMELVRGVPITEFCDQNHLPVRERLELFVHVCQAVQHAHQKGIIHRDLKPSNVLVTLHDDKPVVKVIDFGIAKATGERLTDKTLFTGFGQMIGSPLYMSPEQAGLSGQDVDTRSDIYSLGVLLYELLTGTTPFDKERLREANYEEFRRIIREEEPAKPSTRISTLGPAAATVSEQRKSDPQKLSRLFKGELDWIVMKCLEKDRNRRYETASSLATDIRRHLNDESVLARPPTLTYRARKFVRRNRILVATGSTVAASLVLGLSLAVAGFVQARATEAVAVAEARKARAVIALIQEMLGTGNLLTTKGPDYPVRQVLDDFAAGLNARPMDEPEVEADIRATIGRGYRALGLRDRAEPHLRRALDLRRNVYGTEHPALAESLVDLAWNAFLSLDLSRSEHLARQAVQIHRSRGEQTEALADALRVQGLTLQFQGRWGEGEPVLREALAVAERSSGGADTALISMIKAGLARSLIPQNRFDEAETLARDALRVIRTLHGDQHPETADRLWVLGDCLCTRGLRDPGRAPALTDFAQAELQYRAALRILRQVHGGPHPSQLAVLDGLVDALRGQYKASGPALAQAREDILTIARQTGAIRHRSVSNVAWARLDDTDLAGAETFSREAVELSKRHEVPYHSPLLNRDEGTRDTFVRAWHLQLVGKNDEAKKKYVGLLPTLKEATAEPSAGAWPFMFYGWALLHGAPEHPQALTEALAAARRAVLASDHEDRRTQALARHLLARAYQKTGHLRQAVETQKSALAVAPFHELFTRRWAEEALVEYLEESGDHAEAVRVLRQGIDARRAALPANHPELATAQAILGSLLAKQQQYEEAERLLLDTYKQLQDHASADPARRRHALERIVKLYKAWGKPKEANRWREVLR